MQGQDLQKLLLSKPQFYCPYTHLSIHSPIFSCLRGLGLTIAVVLLLAFVERPSSLSISSDLRRRSPHWEPQCGVTESIEMVCLIIFTLDLAVKVNTARVENICSQDTCSCLVKKGFQIIFRYLVITCLFVHMNHCFTVLSVLSSELLDWLGGIQKEQMADWLHHSHFGLCH